MLKGSLHLVGVDPGNSGKIPPEALDDCPVVVLSERFSSTLGKQLRTGYHELVPIAPLDKALERIASALTKGNVCVLASGDPMFFGIGKRLVQEFGTTYLKVWPALSSLQYAFSHFGINWDDAKFLSLHGRSDDTVLGQILAVKKVALLTDAKNNPQVIARKLSGFLGSRSSSYAAYVAENIGLETERFISGTLDDICTIEWGGLCCMVLVRVSEESEKLPLFGLSESDISHSRGLITKSEVRAAAIHALAVPANAVVWDVGAGSGSVGLEISRMCQGCIVFAVEKNEQQQYNIDRNIDRYGAYNVKLISGPAPEGLLSLPDPDRVFIGGSGGNLSSIIDISASRLSAGGRIVVTAVLEKTLKEAPVLLEKCGLEVSISRVTVQRVNYPDQETIELNPISIIVGRKG